MKVWISREKILTDNVRIWLKKPKRYVEKPLVIYEILGTEELMKISFDMDLSTFKEFFGFLPEPGTCVQKELELK